MVLDDEHQELCRLGTAGVPANEMNFWIALVQLGKSYGRMGSYEEALAACRKAAETGPTEALSLTGYTYAVSGRRQDGERILSELVAKRERSYVPPYNIAMLYHGLGDTDEALKWLERAYEERDPHVVFLDAEPGWDHLRADPRFAELMKRVGPSWNSA